MDKWWNHKPKNSNIEHIFIVRFVWHVCKLCVCVSVSFQMEIPLFNTYTRCFATYILHCTQKNKNNKINSKLLLANMSSMIKSLTEHSTRFPAPLLSRAHLRIIRKVLLMNWIKSCLFGIYFKCKSKTKCKGTASLPQILDESDGKHFC